MSIRKAIKPGSIVLCLAIAGCGGNGGTATDISDTSDTYYSIGGMVTGLIGSGLVLQNNAGDDLPIAGDGGFTFSTLLMDGGSYAQRKQPV
jgi:hypothetical protein